ncbi:PTS sugar transporter subunit IIA [Hydrogenophilus thermoluteolus]|nr:PTS sugar transporter subunit IIA [Hydrogenophilus thermoluteolus]
MTTTMDLLASLIATAQVRLDVDASSKKRVLEKVAEAFAEQGCDAGKLFAALIERERLGSTGLGEGIAIPHARVPGLTEPRIAILRLAQPVDFDAVDNQPVTIVVALLVPEQATETHLEILSELAERLSRPEVREAILSAETPEALRAAFRA